MLNEILKERGIKDIQTFSPDEWESVRESYLKIFFEEEYGLPIPAPTSLTFEELREDYFSHAFGEDWRQFYDYLERLGNAFSLEFLSGDANIGKNVPEWFDPSRVEALRSVSDIVKEGRELINAHYNSEDRVRTVSVRLLEFHARYAELLAELVILKATGDDDGALAFYKKMRDECGKYELQFERWYDHGLYFNFILRRLMRLTPKDAFNAIDAI